MPIHATSTDTELPVRFDDIRDAAARIAGVAHRTPVLTSSTLDSRLGARVFVKCENFQRAGAFKFRGAYNALARLDAGQRARGVLAFSSGNHAQAVALAGRALGIPATIIMPNDAPSVKRRATEGYGAEVIAYDPARESRETLAGCIAEERGLTLIPPYNHPDVIAGQGTVALELFEDVPDLDALVVCCGGGGLLSGSAIAARAMAPACSVVGVEPEAGDDACRSFRTGTLQTVSHPDTIADGARTPSLGTFTFPIVLRCVDDMVSVPDTALVEAMRFLWERMKIVVEPTGALALAGLLAGRLPAQGRRIGVIVSGGNIDLSAAGRLFS
ncbi:MAG: threo-3-hydroxy-L-aspartate ammonia-lyase [Rhodothermales bacterium]